MGRGPGLGGVAFGEAMVLGEVIGEVLEVGIGELTIESFPYEMVAEQYWSFGVDGRVIAITVLLKHLISIP